MSFSVSFGSTSSEKRELDKTVSYSVTLTGTLRNASSVVDPVIVIDQSASTLATCNYMSIPTFGRYYFITDVVALSDQLCEVHGHCDVLSTYKAGIRTNRAIIGRSAQEGNWNLFLTDPMMKVTNKSSIITRQGFKSFPKNQFSLMIVTMG